MIDELLDAFFAAPGKGYGTLWRSLDRKKSSDIIDILQRDEQVVRSALSKLKRRGLVTSPERGMWALTKKGYTFVIQRVNDPFRARTYSPGIPKTDKKMIILFDIPERKKRLRNWLREQLTELDFEMIQKSVWMGPAPIPHEFTNALKETNTFRYLRFFEIKQEDLI